MFQVKRNLFHIPHRVFHVEPSTFGERVAQARRELAVREHRDIKPSDLAERLGVTPKTVYTWERDDHAPERSTLELLAAALGVTPGWLLFGQEPKYLGTAAGPTQPYVPTDEERARAARVIAETDAEVARRERARLAPKKRSGGR